jgi:quinol monooxygenase YgiN
MSIFVRAGFAARPGRRADFLEIAQALAAQAAAEPGTRTFRWFAAGPDHFVALEEYVDEDAAVAHNERGAALLARVPECAEMVEAEIYGPIGPRIAAWAEANPLVRVFPDLG